MLAADYDLEAVAIESGESHYTIFTPEAVFQLHYDSPVEETLSMLQCWDYLQVHGFSEIWPLRVTAVGDLGVYLDDHIGYMTARSGGRPGELGLRADAVMAAKVLAKLHLLSQELPVSVREGLDKAPPIRPNLARRREELELFRTMALHRLFPRAFDLLFLKVYEYAACQAARSMDVLAQIDIDQLENQPELGGLLQGKCHGRSFWATDEGKMQLPHLQGSTWGLLAQDTVSLITNVGNYTEWSLSTAHRVLSAYQGIRPLQHVELMTIYGLGIFPRGIWDTAYDYYKGNRKRDEPEALEALREEWQRAVLQREYWQWLLGDELGV